MTHPSREELLAQIYRLRDGGELAENWKKWVCWVLSHQRRRFPCRLCGKTGLNLDPQYRCATCLKVSQTVARMIRVAKLEEACGRN